MSEYFSYFPKVNHDLTNIGQTVELTNIFRRFIVRSDVQDRSDVYYEYNIQAGDRPDTIAEKYYGDADMAWLVLHYNNIIDPIFGWALFNQDFDNYIKSKYNSIATAQATVHEYRQIIREAEVKYDGTRISQKYVVIDEDTYNTLGENVKVSVSKYDWEIEENEKRRKIKILDKQFLEKVKDEVKVVLKDGI